MRSEPLAADRQLIRRKAVGSLFTGLFILAILIALTALAILIADVVADGWNWLSASFLTNLPSRFPDRAGVKPHLYGTIWVMVLTAAFTFPAGVGAALYLEEFAPQNRLTAVIRTNISNLAGVPSIVYGLLGLGIFVELMRMGPSLLAGALTLSLLVLPVVIIASQEAIRAVPDSMYHAALALGATRLEAMRAHVLPAAMPGILTGTILALSRAIGETAPLIAIGAVAYLNYTPDGLGSGFSVLPIQIYDWTSRPQPEFHHLAAAAIIVLLVLLLSMNLIAIVLRNYFQNRQNW